MTATQPSDVAIPLVTDYVMGVDLGQRQDYTAIAVLARTVYQNGRDMVWACPRVDTRYEVRFLERLPLGTPYTEVVDTVQTRLTKLPFDWRSLQPVVVADATGVGAPVMEMLRDARLSALLQPVIITGGEKAVQERRVWKVPKRDLIAGVQLMLEQGELTMAQDMDHAAELVKEMLSMRVRVTSSLNEQIHALARTGSRRYGPGCIPGLLVGQESETADAVGVR